MLKNANKIQRYKPTYQILFVGRLKAFSLFLPFPLPQPRQSFYPWLTILRYWSWLRAEQHKPLIIPELDHFDSFKRFAETAASREEGTWEKKQSSCSNKGFLLPGARWQLSQPVCVRSGWSQEMYRIKQALYLLLPSVFPNLALWFHSSVPTRSTAHTPAQGKGISRLQKWTLINILVYVAKPKSGFCLTKFWKLHTEGALWKGTEGPSLSYTCSSLYDSVYPSDFISNGKAFPAILQWVPRVRKRTCTPEVPVCVVYNHSHSRKPVSSYINSPGTRTSEKIVLEENTKFKQCGGTLRFSISEVIWTLMLRAQKWIFLANFP